MSWLPVATLLLSVVSIQPSLPLSRATSPAADAAIAPPAATHSPETGLPAPLNVMTFNIRYGTANDGENHWLKRRDQLLAMLRELQPDIIGLQEALHGQIDEILAAVPGYAYVGVGRSDGRRAGEYAAILYRSARLQVRRSDTFWFSDTPAVIASKTWGNTIERICTWAYFEDAQGTPFYVYNVHLDHHSQPSRERSASLLLDRIAGRAPDAPVIVTGDFNAGEQNRAILLMRGKLRDTFRECRPDAEEVGTFSGFTYGNTRGDKIDYVFVSKDVEVLDADIVRASRDGRYPSDHFPVTARVTMR
jgi:endonuclease/exonuclease/phosphatase family metal-dependent hydrolase